MVSEGVCVCAATGRAFPIKVGPRSTVTCACESAATILFRACDALLPYLSSSSRVHDACGLVVAHVRCVTRVGLLYSLVLRICKIDKFD